MANLKATMHSITAPESKEGASLGPTIYGEVEFEGMPVRALLDTGSPVTIASLDCVLQALAKLRTPEQMPDAWEKMVRARLEPPSISLLSYGGNSLNIIRQIRCQILRGQYSGQAVVHVQGGAPVPLLIGTDMQAELGFAFLQCSPGGTAVDLFQGNCLCVKEAEPSAESLPREQSQSKPAPQDVDTQPIATVHLLHAMRVPAQHARLVKARVEGPQVQDSMLFEPEQAALAKEGLIIEDGTAHPIEGGHVTLVVQNYGCEPIQLQEGDLLGQVHSVTAFRRPWLMMKVRRNMSSLLPVVKCGPPNGKWTDPVPVQVLLIERGCSDYFLSLAMKT